MTRGQHQVSSIQHFEMEKVVDCGLRQDWRRETPLGGFEFIEKSSLFGRGRHQRDNRTISGLTLPPSLFSSLTLTLSTLTFAAVMLNKAGRVQVPNT